jgi:molecular chaperone DnaK (HSP70)
VATARIKELIDEGYLFEPPGHRKLNPSGVNAKVLRVTDRPEGGTPLDKVRIEVTLTIDHNGVYGATAKVVGGGIQSNRRGPIKRQRITITAPHPDSYKSVFSTKNTSTVSRMETEQYADDIVDVDYQVIND